MLLWLRWQMPRLAITALAVTAIGLALIGMATEDDASGHSWLGAWMNSCKIKGNVSAAGERIYHVPGQTYYHAAYIRNAGERWFCSEVEAQQAGWRRARL